MITGFNIVRNSFTIIAGNFLNKAVSVAVLFYLTGYLGPAGFGRFSFVIAYVTFFGIFTDLGLNTVLTREISGGSVNRPSGFGNALILRFAASLATAALVISSIALLGYPSEVLTLTIAATLLLFFSFRGLFFRNVLEIPFQVLLRMDYPAVINFLNELLTLAAVVWLVRARASLPAIVLAVSLANIPCFAVEAFFSMRLIRPSFRIDVKLWKRLLKESLPLGAAMLLEGVFVITPLFTLSRFSTEEALGLYSLPLRLSSSLWIVPVAVMLSMLPKMSSDAKTSKDALKDSLLKGLKAMLSIGLPMALVTDYYSSAVIDLFTGGRYPGSATALSLMIWGTLMYFINTVFYYSFTAAGLQRINTAVWAAISALTLIFSLFLIPRYHHVGAALSFVAPLSIGTLLNFYCCRAKFGFNAIPLIAGFLLPGLATAVVLLALPFRSIISVALSLAVYLTLLFGLKTISYSEWHEWLNGRQTKPGG